MSIVSQSITINAPVSKVFDVVVKPENWVKYVTSLVDVRDFSGDAPAKGSTFMWEYKMMGIRFTGKGTVTENMKDTHFSLSLESKFPIREAYVFKDLGGGATEFKVTIEYEMPGQMLKVLEKTSIVEKMNDLEAKSVLEKVKALCEEG
jgi:uncharacterized membrane protein